MDPRITKLANVLVHYSLNVQKGDWVVIDGAYLAEELLREAYREVLAAGGHPTLRTSIDDVGRIFLNEASQEQMDFIAPSLLLEFKKADKFLFVMGGWNTRAMTRVDPAKMVASQKARRIFFKTLMQRSSAGQAAWVGTLFPTHAAAQDAEMSLAEYQEFVFRGCLLDKKDPVGEWKKISARQAKICRDLSKLGEIRITGPETDIRFGVRGRTWVNCDGKANFPDGEVFTAPIENSVEGRIHYAFPAVMGAREVTGVRLSFRRGRVVEATAEKGQDFLHQMIDSDPGARRVGELAFGTNPAVKTFTRNTLFDEKIGGTMHVALGASIPESGGRNKSAIHWDMVCDTRKGFTVYGDDKPIHRNGKFLIGH